MGIEIERRWLIKEHLWFPRAQGKTLIRQGYLSLDPARTQRIRFETGRSPVFCIKGLADGIKTPEHETEVNTHFARAAWEMCGDFTLEKMRYRIPYEGVTIEVDEFIGKLEGLYLAEVEFIADYELFEAPSWFGKEVTADHRYRNAMLVQHGIPSPE